MNNSCLLLDEYNYEVVRLEMRSCVTRINYLFLGRDGDGDRH